MDNCIKYIVKGKRFSFPTSLCFSSDESNDNIARKVYLAVSFDTDNRIKSGEIGSCVDEHELATMTDEQIQDWFRTTNIEFYDYITNKVLRMKHMSDFFGNYTIDKIESRNG